MFKGTPKRKDYGCSYSPMSELSKSPWTTLIPPVAQEEGPRGAGTGPTRDPPGNPEARVRSSSTRSSQAEGTGCRGRGGEERAFPTVRGRGPRGGDAPRTRSSSAAPSRGENARCTGLARPPSTVSTSAWPLPSRAPSLRSDPPAYLCV